jgi:PAS domain S-box-containing protein
MSATSPPSREQFYFESFFQLSNDLICVASVDGYFKRVNPAFENTLGWDESYLLSNTFHDLIHPDDVSIATQQMENFNVGLSADNLILRTRCKSGDYKHIQWVTTPDRGTGQLFAIGRDITLEKEREKLLHSSENRFRAFFESSQGLMCTLTLAVQ